MRYLAARDLGDITFLTCEITAAELLELSDKTTLPRVKLGSMGALKSIVWLNTLT